MSGIVLGPPPVNTPIDVKDWSGKKIGTVRMQDSGPMTKFLNLIHQILEGVREQLAPPEYTLATLPDPALGQPGRLIYVSDGLAGQKLRYSDGSSWVIAG